MAAIGGLGTGGGSVLSRGQLVAILAVLAGGAALGWFGFKQAFGDGTTVSAPIQTITVTPRTVQQTATTSGTVASQRSAKLTFAIAGRLASVSVLVGQSVQAGDVIATLDTTQLQIALDQAKSTQTSAQARLDALLAGQTPDVIEAARAGIAQAQAAETSAEGQLTSAQTGKITANNSAAAAANTISTAQDQVATAQNGVTTAHSQVINAQNALILAQNAYTNLLAGPTPQDIAVSQTAVDAARGALDTAQANYDRLVNHTDIATRSETTSLLQASSAYQAALANLANSQPQPPNPIDVANQQLAVQTAQQQLALAQGTASNAQLTLTTALQNLHDVMATPQSPGPVAIPQSAQSCVALQGGACVFSGEPIQPTAAELQAAQQNNPLTQAENAVLSAQNQANQAALAVVSANQTYQLALNNLQKLLNPTTTQNLTGLQAQVDLARQQLDVARRNFDAYMSLSDLPVRPETSALSNAQAAYNSALAQYQLKIAPPRDTDISNAQAALSNAQAGLDSALAAERNASVAVGSAQTAVSNASLAANSAAANASNADSSIYTAAGGVRNSQEAIVAAQKKLDELVGPPLPTDVAQLVEAVRQTQLAVQNAQSNLDSAQVRAPFSAIITAIPVNPGDQVTSGTTIVQIVDPTHFEIDAQVDETTYGQIRLGMPVTVRMDALPNQSLTGVISNIIPNGVTQQGVVTFPIVITLTTPGVVPPSGATASQILIVVQAKANVLAVPPRYIYRDSSGQQVIDVIKDGRRIPTAIQPGSLSSDQLTEIASGLKPGDQIALPLKSSASSGARGSTFVGQGVPGVAGGGGGGGGGGGR